MPLNMAVLLTHTSLTMPTSHWSEIIATDANIPEYKIPPFDKLAAI